MKSFRSFTRIVERRCKLEKSGRQADKRSVSRAWNGKPGLWRISWSAGTLEGKTGALQEIDRLSSHHIHSWFEHWLHWACLTAVRSENQYFCRSSPVKFLRLFELKKSYWSRYSFNLEGMTCYLFTQRLYTRFHPVCTQFSFLKNTLPNRDKY